MSATLALVVWQRPHEMAHRTWVGLAAGRGALAALVILLLHANYVAPQAEPAGPEDPMTRALAEYLTEEGALFYGASWCPHCQEQKRLFGASASRLPYIECSPAGPQHPAGAVVQSGQRAELPNLGHQRPDYRRGGVESGAACRRRRVSTGGRLQVAFRPAGVVLGSEGLDDEQQFPRAEAH